MSGESDRLPPGLVQLLLLAAVFFLPLLVASWIYYSGGAMAPEGRTNHGAILEPIVNARERLPNSQAAALSADHWLLVYADEGRCEDACFEALFRLRQSRLMLGPDMDRVQRVFLHGRMAPDRVFLEEQHPGLAALRDPELARLLAEKRPEGLRPGGLFLIDPLGNLVMYFSPDIAPGDMVDDIEHLLDVSRIG
ncbi:MAG TPA: hypothetical protein VHG33_01420 [Woeseiaceae bacterium]|nr:hypothetical protein [Woeseiaceae bacterium]